jgi:hypothetical protein
MKCFNHNEMDATATCQECSKGLCVNCSSRFNAMLCESCLLNHNKSVSTQMYTGLAITIAILLGFTYFIGGMELPNGQTLGFAKAILPSLILAFTYWGWKFMTNHFPSLSMGSGTVWIMYFMIKFVAALHIGLIVGPYQIYKMLKEINSTNKVKSQIASGEI